MTETEDISPDRGDWSRRVVVLALAVVVLILGGVAIFSTIYLWDIPIGIVLLLAVPIELLLLWPVLKLADALGVDIASLQKSPPALRVEVPIGDPNEAGLDPSEGACDLPICT